MFDFVNLVHHANQKINCVMAKEDLITKLEEGHEVHCPKKCHQQLLDDNLLYYRNILSLFLTVPMRPLIFTYK